MKPIRFVMALAMAAPLAAVVQAGAAGTEDKAIEVIVAARTAMGGQRLEAVRTISATGEYRRLMGEREINGEATIEIIAPDKIRRTEEMGIPGGPTMSRTVTLDGTDYWEDVTNRGGGGFMRFGGPGGPGGPGGGQGPSEADRERFRQMAERRLHGELQRYLLVWLMRSDAQLAYGGEAEAEDGRADVIDVTSEGGTAMRVFFDQQTHLPLMLTYQGVQPRMMVRQGRPGGNAGTPPDPEEVRRRMAEPPKMVTFEVRLSEFKDVDGVLLPHQMAQSVDGTPTEEWTVSQFKVNPNLKPESFKKKTKS